MPDTPMSQRAERPSRSAFPPWPWVWLGVTALVIVLDAFTKQRVSEALEL